MKQYGWLLHRSYTQVMKSLFVAKGMQQHIGPARGLDLYNNGKPIVKQLKYLPPTKQNNVLVSEMIALKLGIVTSALRMTPAGFGELIYDDGSANSLNGMMVKSIAAYADSLMMGKFNALAGRKVFADSLVFRNLAATIRRINSAFEGPIDTVSFASILVMKGVRPLSTIPYLHPNAAVQPAQIARTVDHAFDAPRAYSLHQNYPNPFNPTTTIQFELPEEALVTLKVYDLVGREVATLLDHEDLEEGLQEIDFDGGGVASGVYFYRIVADPLTDAEAGGARSPFMSVKKMILVR